MIFPSEGLNLYVIGVTPFLLIMALGILLVILYPPLAVWLPTAIKGN